MNIFQQHNSKISMKDALYLLGIFYVSKECNGIQALREYLESNYTRRTWYRLSKN